MLPSDITNNSFELETDAWWNQLSIEDRERAFYSVVKRIYDNEIAEQSSYRYILYDVFGFGPEYYGLGMACGFMSLHNAIKTPEEETILANYKAAPRQTKLCSNKVNGSCPLPNIQCNYLQCEVI